MTEWWRDIHQAFRSHGIRQVAYVPDAGHASLIEACIADDGMRAIALTTVEEGVALLAGAWLGDQRGVLLMQSSGVGNCINMFSLAKVCRFPIPVFVTMRGQWSEFNPWQHPMGQTAQTAMETAGFEAKVAAVPEHVAGLSNDVIETAYADNAMTVLLLHQGLMPVKTFGK